MKETGDPEISLKSILFRSFKEEYQSGKHLFTAFSNTLLIAESIVLCDDDLLNLKEILVATSTNQKLFLSAANLLKKLDFKIQNIDFLGRVVSIPINAFFARFKDFDTYKVFQDISNENEYLKSVTLVCTKLNNIKNSIMEATFKNFCQFISSIDINSCQSNIVDSINTYNMSTITIIESISKVLSSLFQLEINLIWRSQENQKFIRQNIKPNHFTQLLNLIQNSPNSVVQMLITEWMWRVKNCLPPSFDIQKSFQKLKHLFLQINETNFRSSLHCFIRTINLAKKEKNQSKIIFHFRFTNIIFNDIDLESSGYIDLNQDNIAVWFIEKRNKKVPDVIIFKFFQIYNINIDEKLISFLSKEKLIAFEVFSITKPMKFVFYCYDIITKSQSLIFTQRCRCNKFSQGNQIKIKPKSKKVFDHFDNFSNKRIYADSPQSKMSIPNSNKEDEKEDNIKGGESLVDNNNISGDIKDGNDINKEEGYKIKIMTFDEIERSLDDLQVLFNKMVNELEEKVMSELNDIIDFTEKNIKELHILSQKHQKAVTNAQMAESFLLNKTSDFEDEYENSFIETEQKKNQIFNSYISQISHDKAEFINETDKIFMKNALMALSNNLQNFQTHIEENLDDK